MKKIFIMPLIIVTMTLLIGMTHAEAKRLGGGTSFGRQSAAGTHYYTQKPMQHNLESKNTSSVNKQSSPWKNILGGALLGLGLGALLSHFGLGSALISMITTILVVMLLAFISIFVYRIFRKKVNTNNTNNTTQSAYANVANQTPQIGSMLVEPMEVTKSSHSTILNSDNIEKIQSYEIPTDFNTTVFLRNAKTYFIRLQAAWDKADVNDIYEFTTPEMFSELKIQLQERGTSSNYTDVISLDADILGIETTNNYYLASVKFYGFIKEKEDSTPVQFSEIWNLSKPVSGQSGWVLAGIQQLS